MESLCVLVGEGGGWGVGSDSKWTQLAAEQSFDCYP